jgi:hypothetical protein
MLELDEKICRVTFSHSDCADVWRCYFGEMDKYFHTNMKHFICVETKSELLPRSAIPLTYEDGETYPRRLLSCLEKLTDFEYIFFDHEDMFLYGPPNYSKLAEYYNYMQNLPLDHIRLIKGGPHKSTTLDKDNSLHLLSLRSKWIFSIQPSYWRKDRLMDILKSNIDVNVWDLELKSQKVVKKMKLKAAYSHSEGLRRGIFHFDNAIYPYVATAIGKGKWNLSEYREELGNIFREYKIEPSLRGWH